MDDQDTRQPVDDKSTPSLLPNETETTEKAKSDNSSNVQCLDVHSEVYTPAGTENEVITIITQETEGEVFIYERNDVENAPSEAPAEYIQLCDSNNSFEEVNNSDVNVDGMEEDEEVKEELENDVDGAGKKAGSRKLGHSKENAPGIQSKNFKNVILEDWDVEVPQNAKNHENCTEALPQTPQEVIINNDNCTVTEISEPDEVVHSNNENQQTQKENSNEINVSKTIINNIDGHDKNTNEVKSEIGSETNSREENPSHEATETPINNQNGSIKEGVTQPQLVEKRLEMLCSKVVTKEDIVKILDDSSEKITRPIVGGKDLFFSIELTKRLNQKLSHGKNKTSETTTTTHNDPCNNNNNNNTTTVDDRQKIVDILEADEITDWKSTPSKSDLGPKENGNDMEISNAIKRMESDDTKPVPKTPRRTPSKKLLTIDKEMERTLALQQLREEFPTRKWSRKNKKFNQAPFLASTVLEKAMTSPEVTTALKPGPPRRRPCYLPEKPETTQKETVDGVSASTGTVGEDFTPPGKPSPIVKTYSAKRKSTDAENDIKTTLEAVAKALNERSDEVSGSKPKKQKTVTEDKNKRILIKKKRKLKAGARMEKKMKSELEKLLGDEGAVRMLYDTQHSEGSTSTPKKMKFKTTTGLKKDLVLKTKLVKNAVMRLSGGLGAEGGVLLRGKRRSQPQQEEEPLFSSTPSVVLYKPKKKQRAEASRILYRHSSSESFDSSEGYRRTSFDAEGMTVETTNASSQPEEIVTVGAAVTERRGRPRKSEVLKKRMKKMEGRQRKVVPDKGIPERLSTDSASAGSSKLNFSNVPVRKSSRPRVVSKKYSIWSSTSMDSLSVESLGLKKLKKASTELGKKLNCKELTIMQYEHLVQIVLTPSTTMLKNSLNHEVLQDLLHVFSYLSKDDSCRVVLLSSRGNTFCQGVDINRIISFGESEKKKGVSQLVKSIREFVACLASFKKPVVAGVQGAAIGLGVTLLPYCDLIISSDTASFYTPYVKLGQAPEGAPIQTFPLINRQLVSELLFKCHKMTAADALKYGLVTQIIPEGRFEEDLIMISRNMASQPVQGMQSIKFLLRKSEQWDVSDALQAEGELLEEHWNTAECLNNMIKFLNSGELQLKQNSTG